VLLPLALWPKPKNTLAGYFFVIVFMGSRIVSFGIVTLSITGGLQRDCVTLARKLLAAGHKVIIYCARQDGAIPDDLTVRVLPNDSLTNHGCNLLFSNDLAKELTKGTKENIDCVVGFDKLEGLDIYYCGDQPAQPTYPFLKLLPRYLGLFKLERACFGPESSTLNIMLSNIQERNYIDLWNTPRERLVLIPPNLEPERRKPDYRADRNLIREELGYTPTDWVWLGVATQPRTKGLDRTLAALKQFLDAKLLLIGTAGASMSALRTVYRAGRLNLTERMQWLGHREDIPRIAAAADVLVHPARLDTTGKIILEAVVNGLPVISSEVCGYSNHVLAANAGIVLGQRFSASDLLAALAKARNQSQLSTWSRNGANYGRDHPELYTGFDRAVDVIERFKKDKKWQKS
jgi:UDP-glucose:(heptosyl)LPS alpha-1,3-glucosyltransferase